MPEWRIIRILTGTDRQRHHTRTVIRFVLCRSTRVRLVLLVVPGQPETLSARMLVSLLLWWRQVSRSSAVEKALLLVPEAWSEVFLNVLPWLDIPSSCFKYELDTSSLRQIYPAPATYSRVRPPYVLFPLAREVPAALQEIKAHFPTLQLTFRRGRWELCHLGLQVAWQCSGDSCCYEFENPKPFQNLSREVIRSVETILHLRRFPPPAMEHPCYKCLPERWLESLILENPKLIHVDFEGPVFPQVPSKLDGSRRILDLLAVTSNGRLAVIELKVEKSLDIIFQGLEYWERVRHHLRQGDFTREGYFEGRPLSREDPLLYLVCPLFEFHVTMRTIRGLIRCRNVIQCVGINTDWRNGLRVLRRFSLGKD
ncbi:MAG: hypothetical protein HY645_06505 [Acidobacteria bacterium]|nr:hypothetical protein [Acidobacteriota bacterium]